MSKKGFFELIVLGGGGLKKGVLEEVQMGWYSS